MLNIKKIAKILLISILSLILLLVITILLLSIFFPSELVRKEIEKKASEFLETDVKLEKLKFSIFSGLELIGLSVQQFGSKWQNQYIVNIDKAYLKYNLLPILFKRELSVKACVVESGEINLERTKDGSNWDHFINIFNAKSDSSNKSKKNEEKESEDKKEQKSIPIDIDMKKIGIENIDLNYIDRTFFNIPLFITLNDTSILARNLKTKNNKPFDLTSKISINVNGGEYINLNTLLKSTGKLKIFDDESNKIFLNGPLKVDLVKINFFSKLFKELIVKFIGDFIENSLGPELSSFLKDPELLKRESEIHFDNILKNSKGTIDKEIERTDKISAKKEDLIEYKTQVVNDFIKELNSPFKEIDSKIDNIDDRISPIIDTASSIPFVERFADLGRYKKRTVELQEDSKEQRDSIKEKYKSNLEKELMGKINSAIPSRIPSYGEYEKEFLNKVNFLKNDFTKNKDKFSISSLIDTYIPDLSFMDKGIEISNIFATYILDKKESKSKDFKLKSKYLNINGGFNNKKSEIDFIGSFNINNDFFKIGFLPKNDLEAKVKIYGDIKDLNVKILDFPKLKIDSNILKDALSSIIKNFLNKNYGEANIISGVLKKFEIIDINEEELKNKLLEIKNLNFEKAISEKDNLLNSIDKDTGKIIEELKSRIPGL